MAFALFKRGAAIVSLVADVGPGSVGIALVRVEKNISEILAAKRISISIEERDVAHELAATKQAFIDAYAAISTDAARHAPSHFYISIRSPWATSRTACAERVYEADFVIPPSVVGELAREAMSSLAVEKQRMFEAGVVRVELNGYATAHPKNKRAHHVSVVVLASEMDTAIRSTLVEASAQIFPGVKPILRSTTRALSNILRADPVHHRTYLLVECGALTTSCSIIKKDEILDSGSIPQGFATISKQLAGPNGMPEEILGLLRLVGSESCTDATCATILSSLSTLEPELVRQFGELFGTLAKKHRLPNTLVLSTHPDLQMWLSTFLSRLDFSQFTTTMRPFNIEIMGSEDVVSKGVLLGPGIARDMGLSVAASLVNNELSISS